MESTFNRAVKIMFDLPWATHRYFIEPLIESPHVSRIVASRYLSFIAKIKKSVKYNVRQLLELTKRDTRTTTVHNLTLSPMGAFIPSS